MKKHVIFLLLLLPFMSGFSQVIVDHPLQRINRPVQAKEFVIFHKGNATSTSAPTNTTLGHYDRSAGLTTNQRIVMDDNYVNTSVSYNTTDAQSINVLTLDMNGDGYDEVIEAYQQATKIVLSRPNLNANPLSMNSGGPSGVIQIGTVPAGVSPQIKMAKGDFKRNGKWYFAVASPSYTDKKINLHVFFWDSIAGYTRSCAHIFADSLYFDVSNQPAGNYDITINDFDGDSIPDIAFTGLEKEPGGFRSYLKTFKVNTAAKDSFLNWTLTPMGKQTIASVDDFSTSHNLAISSGMYDSTSAPQNQIAVALAFVDRNNASIHNRNLYLASTGSGANGLNTITVAPNPFATVINNAIIPAVSIVSGELNSNANDEIVLAFDGEMQIFSVSSGLVITPRGANSGGGSASGLYELANNNSYLSIGDADMDLENDILIVTTNDNGNALQWFMVTVLGASLDLNNVTIKGQSLNFLQTSYSGGSSSYRYAAAFGEFSGGRAILKAPTYSVRKTITPLIVNNGPPYHFDMLDTVQADITNCFPNFTCNMNSQYKEVTTTSSTVQTTLKSDWGVSGTLSGGGSPLGIGLKASVTQSYGEEFSQVQGSTSSVMVSTLSTARADDQVYGVLTDYDVYEYPVDSSGVTIGYVLAMLRTGTPIVQWMDSKSADAFNYIPDHEVGNLLSYASTTDFTQYAGNLETIKPGTGFNVGSGGTLNFEMRFTDFASQSVSETRTFGTDVNVSASYGAISLDAKGTYNSSEMHTHTSTAQSEVSYLSNLQATLNLDYSDANYTITPNVYWAKNGAITLGYAVDPSIPSGGTTNFWKDHYITKPDLTVIMPWKYDPEKGYSLGNTPDKRRLCKSLSFSKTSFITGDSVLITAWIQNYSLMDYTGPVDFQFYMGDPQNGGILMADVNGQTTLTVNSTFPARNRKAVQFNWKVPAGINPGPRIYIVIDPADQINEVHEDNNIGFNVLGEDLLIGIKNTDPLIAFQTKLFPNPSANGWSQLQLEIPEEGKVEVEIFDLQGRLMQSAYSGTLQSGHYLLPVALTELPAGFLLVQVKYKDHREVLRLVNAEK